MRVPSGRGSREWWSRREGSLGKDASKERGAVGVVVALLLLVVIGFLALSVDVGVMLVKRRYLVNANDAAALAAALSCARGEGEAEANAQAESYAAANAGEVSLVEPPVYEPSCDAPSGKVTVRFAGTQATLFAPVLGFRSEVDVSAIATAAWTGSGGAYAIFAGSETCAPKTIDWPGSNNHVTGAIHSNNELYLGGTGNVVDGSTTSVDEADINAGNTLNPAPAPGSVLPYPVDFTIAEYAPGGAKADLAAGQGRYYNAGNNKIDTGWLQSQGLFNSGTGTLATGLYFTELDIDISASNLNGAVTLVSRSGIVKLSGSQQDMEPWDPENLLIFSDRQSGCFNPAVNVDGSNSSWTGIVYAPRGMIEMPGSNNSTINGSLIGATVRLNGSNLTINAPSDGGGGPAGVSLIG
jgi:Flp pilus assembly protein TadG